MGLRLALALPERSRQIVEVQVPDELEAEIIQVHADLIAARKVEARTGSPVKEVDRCVSRLADLYVMRRKQKPKKK